MARGSRRIHTLGGQDFQALSPHRLLGSVGEVATGGGGVRALPVGERAQAGTPRVGNASLALQVDWQVFWAPPCPPDSVGVGALRPCLMEPWRLWAPGALDLLS